MCLKLSVCDALHCIRVRISFVVKYSLQAHTHTRTAYSCRYRSIRLWNFVLFGVWPKWKEKASLRECHQKKKKKVRWSMKRTEHGVVAANAKEFDFCFKPWSLTFIRICMHIHVNMSPCAALSSAVCVLVCLDLYAVCSGSLFLTLLTFHLDIRVTFFFSFISFDLPLPSKFIYIFFNISNV